jgi:AcrR family transcriptional regulator
VTTQNEGTTTRRRYKAPAREAAARETRRRIVAAARRLFLADGYAPTSVRAVAAEAGVAEKTVYLQFDTKSALLKAVVETTIVGDDEEVPASGRQWFLDVVAESELDAKLRLLVAATSDLHERTGAVFTMARGAAAVDPDVADLWAFGKRGHRADMTILADSFAQAGLVPPGLSDTWVMQLLYALLGPETWQLVRGELDVDEQGYRDWLYASLRRAFSPGAPTVPTSRTPTTPPR